MKNRFTSAYIPVLYKKTENRGLSHIYSRYTGKYTSYTMVKSMLTSSKLCYTFSTFECVIIIPKYFIYCYRIV